MATHTADEMTVQIEGNGRKTDPIPMSEFEERTDAAVDRLRARQLSFNVGGREPDGSALKVGGELRLERELRKGEHVKVVITDADGQILARDESMVIAVAFKDEYKDGFLVGTDRIHTVKLG